MKTGITERYANIQEYIKGKISIKELSAILKISRQQAYRLIKRFQEEGIVGLEHKNKNKPSHNCCKNLKIKTIPAFSPQAKGRVERSNQTHQNRLIPKLRLNNITTIQQANKYIKNYYLPCHNKKFASPIIENAHRKLPDNAKLDDFSYEISLRKVNNDWTIKYKAKTYQILRKNFCPAKSTIFVKETFCGKIILLFKNSELSYIIV